MKSLSYANLEIYLLKIVLAVKQLPNRIHFKSDEFTVIYITNIGILVIISGG